MPKVKLKQRADGRYCVRYKDQTFYGKTQKEALDKRDAYRNAEAHGELLSEITTFRAYAGKWVSTYKANVCDGTYNEYVRILNDAADRLPAVPIDKITPTDLVALFNPLAGRSDSYITKYTSTIKSCFQAAYRDGVIHRDPSVGLKRPTGTSGTHRVLEPWEDNVLFDLQDHRMGPAVIVMRYAGLRRGEVCYLDVDRDVDFVKRTITVRGAVAFDDENQPSITPGKTYAAQRTIPLLAPVSRVLWGMHGLVITKRDGTMVTQAAFKRAWESYKSSFERQVNGTQKGYYDLRVRRAKEQGADPSDIPAWIPCTIRTHDFRHSYCSDLYAAGVDVKTAMKWMGHADMDMVMKIYAHLKAETETAAEASLREMLDSRMGIRLVEDQA